MDRLCLLKMKAKDETHLEVNKLDLATSKRYQRQPKFQVSDTLLTCEIRVTLHSSDEF